MVDVDVEGRSGAGHQNSRLGESEHKQHKPFLAAASLHKFSLHKVLFSVSKRGGTGQCVFRDSHKALKRALIRLQVCI